MRTCIGLCVLVAWLTGCDGGDDGGTDLASGRGVWRIQYSATSGAISLAFDSEGGITGTFVIDSFETILTVSGFATGPNAVIDFTGPDGSDCTMAVNLGGDTVSGTCTVVVPGHPESNQAEPFAVTGTRISWTPDSPSDNGTPSLNLVGTWTFEGREIPSGTRMSLNADGSFTISGTGIAGTYTVDGETFRATTPTIRMTGNSDMWVESYFTLTGLIYTDNGTEIRGNMREEVVRSSGNVPGSFSITFTAKRVE